MLLYLLQLGEVRRVHDSFPGNALKSPISQRPKIYQEPHGGEDDKVK